MRISSIVSEALRNIASGTSHAVLMTLAVFICSSLLGGYEMTSVLTLEQQAADRIQADADVTMLVGTAADGTACDNLAMIAGDKSTAAGNAPSISGALRDGPQITPTSTPGRDVTSYEVTPGLIRLFAEHEINRNDNESDKNAPSRTIDTTGIWIPYDLANDFGLSAGSRFETTTGTATVAGVYQWPNDGRDTRLAYAVIIPVSASDGTFDECWAKQWPISDDTDRLLYSTAIVATGSGQSSAGTTQLNKGFDSRYDAYDSYRTRMTKWLPIPGLAIGILLGTLSVYRRRLEYAGALHSGQTRGAQLLGIALETTIWAGLGTICTVTVLAAVGYRYSIADPTAVVIAVERAPIAMLSGTMVSAICTGLCVRESQLFHYFKTR